VGRLLDALSKHLGGAGVTRIRIGSLAANQPAQASHERAGFVPYEVIYEKIISGTVAGAEPARFDCRRDDAT
jgi:hypothetical protein